MKGMNVFTKILFAGVILLLAITVGLGIMTVVKYGNNRNYDNLDETNGNDGLNDVPDNTGETAGTHSAGETGTREENEPVTPAATDTPTPTPTDTPAPLPKIKVAIDAANQLKNNTDKEPVGPGASETADKVQYSAISATTGMSESEWNLIIADYLRDELLQRGYDVFMTRDKEDVDISNGERALAASGSGAAILVSVQADSYTDESVHGIYTQVPSDANPYVPELADESFRLSQNIMRYLIAETGAKERSYQYADRLAIINWSKIPVCVAQLGFMTNPEEDALLQTTDYQKKLAKGIADGIDAYFEGNGER